MKKVSVILTLWAIAGIVTIELFAMAHGMNGKCLALSIGVLGGLGGLTARDVIQFITGKGDK